MAATRSRPARAFLISAKPTTRGIDRPPGRIEAGGAGDDLEGFDQGTEGNARGVVVEFAIGTKQTEAGADEDIAAIDGRRRLAHRGKRRVEGIRADVEVLEI